MHANVPVRFGRGRLDSLGNKGLAAYLIAGRRHGRSHPTGPKARGREATDRARMVQMRLRAISMAVCGRGS